MRIPDNYLLLITKNWKRVSFGNAFLETAVSSLCWGLVYDQWWPWCFLWFIMFLAGSGQNATQHSVMSHEVQATVARCFVQCQHHWCKSLLATAESLLATGAERLPTIGKLHLEFDETSELQRVKLGLLSTDAFFSVLVSRSHGFKLGKQRVASWFSRWFSLQLIKALRYSLVSLWVLSEY